MDVRPPNMSRFYVEEYIIYLFPEYRRTRWAFGPWRILRWHGAAFQIHDDHQSHVAAFTHTNRQRVEQVLRDKCSAVSKTFFRTINVLAQTPDESMPGEERIGA